MDARAIGRRHLLKGAAAAALSAARVLTSSKVKAQATVPNSTGTDLPKFKAPANAADCHMHIYDPARFPMPPNPRVAPMNAAVE